MLEEMLKSCSGIGNNPFCVNIITLTSHGITLEGDAIAVIPQLLEDESMSEPRFINMSGIARKFASIPNTLNIFIMSMCRS